jgi:hypothetical protein
LKGLAAFGVKLFCFCGGPYWLGDTIGLEVAEIVQELSSFNGILAFCVLMYGHERF